MMRWLTPALVAGTLGGLGWAAWGLGWWCQGGLEPGPLPADFRAGTPIPVVLRAGLPREIPWWHRDMEWTGRVRVPRGKQLDLVFRLQPGPGASREEDRTGPLGPRDWSALRLSAGDLGPAFLDARALPSGPGGARVAPDQATDVRLVVRGGTARAEVGHELLEEVGRAWAPRGVLALVGEGSVEALRVRALPVVLEPASVAMGLGLAGLLALLGLLAGKALRAALPGLFLGALLAGAGGAFLARFPRELGPSSWHPDQAPSFERALRLYGPSDAFRNWGGFAGLVSWRGRTDFRLDPAGDRRVLVLGGRQAWGVGVPHKSGTFALQAEGLLGAHRREGKPGISLVVAACRETDLHRQVRILREDLSGFREEAVLLECPPEVLARPGEALALLEELAEELRGRGVGLVVLPPLVPASTPGLADFRGALAGSAQDRAFSVCDPARVLESLEDAFQEAVVGVHPDLGRSGHHALGSVVAAALEKALAP